MATTTNYSWTTPDDSALVKDGASAIRSLGTAIDTTTKNLNPSTTLGDIEYRSSTANTNTRLGIGTTGQVLTVSGGVPSWATPAGNKSYSLLNTGGTNLTGTNQIVVSGISGKDDIFVYIEDASSDNAGSYISIAVNSITDYIGPRINFDISTSTSGSFQATGGLMSGLDAIPIGRMTNVASSYVAGSIRISGAASTGQKVFTAMGGYTTSSNYTTGEMRWTQGIINMSAAITSVTLYSSTGNFDAGKIWVYVAN